MAQTAPLAFAADDLLQAIREVLRGAVYLSPGISHTIVEAYLSKGERPKDPLSPREREVINLIAEGLGNKEIATRINVATHTVKSHVHNILEKLDLHTRLGVASYTHRSRSFGSAPRRAGSGDE